MSKLNWEDINGEEWEAISSEHDDGSPFVWRITRADGGVFKIDTSTPELLAECAKDMSFLSIDDAQCFCEGWETASIASGRYEYLDSAVNEALEHLAVIEVDLPSKAVDAKICLEEALQILE